MLLRRPLFPTSICLLLLAAIVIGATNSATNRDKKHFSLFSVVTFKNEECTSESTITGNSARAGTCYSTTECSDKSGLASGNCAAGFGVCCVFLNTAAATSATISENRTHLRNSEYPSYATATTSATVAYTLKKMNDDICQIRLDFTAFVIGGPLNTVENIPLTSLTNCDRDTMTITTSDRDSVANMNVGTLCGALTDEHLYVELSPTSADAATITIITAVTATLPPAIAKRLWDIKTSQIPCFATYRAPNGCDRYFMQDYGKITSFNFYRSSGTTPSGTAAAAQNSGIELASQRVNTCIRRSKGMCCVEYQVCTYFNGIALTQLTNTGTNEGLGQLLSEGWSIDSNTRPFGETANTNNAGMVDAMCSGDYVEIPSSFTAACGATATGNHGTVSTRYCGARFGINLPVVAATNTHSPVCDCSEPFIARYSTDQSSDVGGYENIAVADTGTNTAFFHRGFCLDFRQTPCWS